ncbi:MAG TPA: YbaK/EbsC family protein, partial [Dermatophilaceae bacterium]|nr:YbaK/EbsC family protein [Dermatophilaceae bacterium]
HRDAYIKIFDRLGFHYVIVQAMAGAMGGSKSEEFLATAENGEDTYVRCESCGYAANVEAVRVPAPAAIATEGMPSALVIDTPGTPTIESLVAFLNEAHARADRAWTAADTLKNVVVLLSYPDGRTEPLVIGVPGDREVDEKRLAAQIEPAVAVPFTDAEFAAHPGLVRGYIGPEALGADPERASATGIRYLTDPRVSEGSAWVTGANLDGKHVIGLVAGRDFRSDGTIEAAEVKVGDVCPSCGQGDGLVAARGIEMGHIFQLGTKYAKALDLKVLDESGKLVTVVMGSYGIGVSRAVACVAEGNHDQFGLVWPREIAPADVHVVATGKDEEVFVAADTLARELAAQGLEVIYDDRRGVSPGVKFKDSELVGVPTIVVVGRGLVDGKVEIKDRRSGERREVAVGEAVAEVCREVRGS